HGTAKMYYAEDKTTYEGNWKNNKLLGEVKVYKDGERQKTLMYKYIEVDSFKYYGPLNGNMRSDRGIYINQDGIEYEGKSVNNKLVGKIKITYPDNTVYIGYVQEVNSDGKGIMDYHRHGEAIINFPDGGSLKGYWENGNLLSNKQVEYISFNRTLHRGQFTNNFSGIGICIDNNGKVYDGNFIGGKFTSGRTTNIDGEICEGNWENGEQIGEMKYIYADGGKYKGGFVAGKLHGKGEYTFPNGDKYEGYFAEDKFHGEGKLTSANGDKYEGEFVENKFHGKGKLTYANGDKYEGDFVEDKFHGKGKLTHADGMIYKGYFAKGESHGKGKLTYSDGEKYEGYFAEGKYHGKGKYTYLNGLTYDGEWKRGQCHGTATVIYLD
ncbi:MAG: hypothetical protein ACK5XF_00370, partial [Neisseriaceae bacterium]